MSKKEIYEQKAEALVTPIVEKYGFELVDVEYVKEGGNFYLRAYVDKPGGITVDDCETVSRNSLISWMKQTLSTRPILWKSVLRDLEDL